MSATIKNPQLRSLKRPAPSIEVDYEALDGSPYAGMAWRDLVEQFTANWVAKKAFAKTATIWAKDMGSSNFGQLRYTCFIAPLGLPLAYLQDLHDHLRQKIGQHARFSDYVQPQPSSWNSLIHIQDGQAWTALDTQEWQAISPNQRKPQG